jgi:hypothetical protein
MKTVVKRLRFNDQAQKLFGIKFSHSIQAMFDAIVENELNRINKKRVRNTF